METSFAPYNPYYELKIFIDTSICSSIIVEKYRKKVLEVQAMLLSYKCPTLGQQQSLYIDAGFDLFIPHSINIKHKTFSNSIDHGIKCAMTFNKTPTAFYLYPRSSTGAKTPLRLSNSVGIIDSGYRGNIIAVFDNFTESNYNVSIKDRLVQICGPNIIYPIYPILVENIEELGNTSRGTSGFGSTGR